MICIDCGSTRLTEPDREGFLDCLDCGAAWIPQIGILNSHMFGTPSDTGEHVNWSAPDVAPEEVWEDILGTDVATFAERSPHLIIFVTEGSPS